MSRLRIEHQPLTPLLDPLCHHSLNSLVDLIREVLMIGVDYWEGASKCLEYDSVYMLTLATFHVDRPPHFALA